MKSLVIGAAGFVGEYLIECLSNCFDHEVYATKLNSDNFKSDLSHVFDLNILNPTAIFELLTKIQPDYIFHLAAQSSIGFSWKNPGLTVDVNVIGSLNVLDALKRLSYKPRILLIGSGEEYGYIENAAIPIKETTKTTPGNIYAATKVCQNMMGNIYSHAYKMPIIMVRAFNHIGPKQAPLFVVSDFCKQVVEAEKNLRPCTIYVGNLEARRDFTDVRDVVRAYALLAEKGTPGETYNVGSGHALKISTVLEKIISQARVPIDIKQDLTKLRPVDIPVIEADISKIKKEIGWSPRISLDETIADVLDYWRAEL